MQVKGTDIISALGVDWVTEQISAICKSEQGRQYFSHLETYTHEQELRTALQELAEIMHFIGIQDPFRGYELSEMESILKKLSIEGAYLLPAEIRELRTWLVIFKDLQHGITVHSEQMPLLSTEVIPIVWRASLLADMENLVDSEGNIKSEASTLLRQIRQELSHKTQALRSLVSKTLKTAKAEGWSPEDLEPTLRNDRLVIPLKADFKGKIQGFVHDVSNTGQTLFLEPVECLPLNNAVRELLAAEQNEIIRILKDFSAKLAYEQENIREYLAFVIKTDKIRAKVVFGNRIHAHIPSLADTEILYLKEARHPFLIAKMGIEAVVPLQMEMNGENKIMVISGPNAGGKSVALKTVGILTWMLHCAIPIPAHPASKIPFFEQIFLDVGDQQSLLNDLSTYSSHIQNMTIFDKHLNQKSLFLIDEMGAGTDPQFGGPIAEAFLHSFVQKGALGIVTTHFSNLKWFAEQTLGVLNGAMLFDSNTLHPTYRFQQGIPGSSFTLEIAAALHVPKSILDYARQKTGDNPVRMEQLIQNLKVRQMELESSLASVKKQENELALLKKHYQTLSIQLEKSKKELLKEAKNKANAIISDANAEIEKTIREIQESKADKTTIKWLRQNLQEHKNTLDTTADTQEIQKLQEQLDTEKAKEKQEEELRVGSWVRMVSSKVLAEILQVWDEKCEVAIGELRMVVGKKEVELLSEKEIKKKHLVSQHLSRQNTISPEIDLRGMRLDEALSALDKYIDDVFLSSLTQFKIIHGIGSGVLKKGVRQLLKKYNQIQFQDAEADSGGAAVTLCSF